MFDFLRDRGSTAEEKRLEALSAYLDNALTPAERTRFEGQLERDSDLRAELERMRLLKLQMRAMPRRRVPRSFALDPALYGRPKAQPMMQLYPVLRGATALTALVFVFTLALGLFGGQSAGVGSPAPAISMSQAVEEEAAPAEMAEAAGGAAPMAAPEAASSERAQPTAMTESPQLAQEVLTDTLAIGSAAPVEGTPLPEGDQALAAVPETDLAQEATVTIEPTAAKDEAVAETAAEPVVSPAVETEEEAGPAISNTTTTSSSILGPIQIAAGIVFILFLILWLVARRRIRNN